MLRDLLAGRTRENMLGLTLSLVECLISCALLTASRTPHEVLLCGLAAVCGVTAFWLYLGDD